MNLFEIIFESNNPSLTRSRLSNVLESFVLKKMYQEVTGFSLKEEMIQFDQTSLRPSRLGPTSDLPSSTTFPHVFKEMRSAGVEVNKLTCSR